jgi:hypothetical protein
MGSLLPIVASKSDEPETVFAFDSINSTAARTAGKIIAFECRGASL